MSARQGLPWTLAVFFLGLVLGGGATHLYYKKSLSDMMDGGPRAYHVKLKHKFMDDLGLDADQRVRLEPVLNELHDRIRTVRRQAEPEIRRFFLEVRPRIVEVLRPDQVQKFEEMETKHKKSRGRGNESKP